MEIPAPLKLSRSLVAELSGAMISSLVEGYITEFYLKK